MALGTTLGMVRSMLKTEIARSIATTAVAQDPELNQIIYNRQLWLANSYSWPHLNERWDVGIGGGTRWVAMPTLEDYGFNTGAVDLQRPFVVEVKWGGIWQPVDYGIGSEEYNTLDSDIPNQQDPIQRWRLEGVSEMEIWPVTAGPSTLRLTGQRVPVPLWSVAGPPPTWNDALTLDMDDLMVVYFAAAYYLLREKQGNAQLLLQMAKDRMSEIRSSYPQREVQTIINGASRKIEKRLVPLIVVAGGH